MLAQAVEAGKVVADQLSKAQDAQQVLAFLAGLLVVALILAVGFYVRSAAKWAERETKLTDAAVERERELGKEHAAKTDALYDARLKSSDEYNARLERLLSQGLENGK